jgi:hypothetical protein
MDGSSSYSDNPNDFTLVEILALSKKTTLPQSRHHILVFDEDWDFLVQNYGPGSANGLGVSTVIRALIHQRVSGLKAKANEAFDKIRSGQGPEAAKEEFGRENLE